jgi:hypothetical protein
MPKRSLRKAPPPGSPRSPTVTGRLDPDSFVPIYQELKELLKSAIAAGVWKANEMIPSKNELAAPRPLPSAP